MSKKKWCLFRHRLLVGIARNTFRPVLKVKYGYKPNFAKNIPEPCLVLFNHQTIADQFLVTITLRRHIYLMATNDIFSNGLISTLLKFSCNPIPKNKSEVDLQSIRLCKQVIEEGRTVGIAPEGNRTYSGELCDVNPAISKLVKMLKVPVVLINIHGGYASEPRWAKKVRKGRTYCEVKRVLSIDEINNLDNDELYNIIINNIKSTVSEGTISDEHGRCEYLERAIYVCPKCGALHTLESNDNSIKCSKCGFETTYTKELTFTNSPVKNVYEWWKLQEEFVKSTKLDYLDKNPLEDKDVKLIQTVNGKKHTINIGNILMNANELKTDTRLFKLEDISTVSCAGKHKLLFTHNNEYYQFVGNERFNPVKYMQFYYHIKYLKGEQKDGEFLGI